MCVLLNPDDPDNSPILLGSIPAAFPEGLKPLEKRRQIRKLSSELRIICLDWLIVNIPEKNLPDNFQVMDRNKLILSFNAEQDIKYLELEYKLG